MRAEGYYWVKPKKNDQVSGEWMVMHWRGTCFYYEAELYYDRDFEEIDERRIERAKPILDWLNKKLSGVS